MLSKFDSKSLIKTTFKPWPAGVVLEMSLKYRFVNRRRWKKLRKLKLWPKTDLQTVLEKNPELKKWLSKNRKLKGVD